MILTPCPYDPITMMHVQHTGLLEHYPRLRFKVAKGPKSGIDRLSVRAFIPLWRTAVGGSVLRRIFLS